MIHELKINKVYYEAIEQGKKLFEIRYDDRNYKVGDYIHFRVKNGFFGSETLTPFLYRITYKLDNVPEYGLKTGYCILGIRKTDKISSVDH